MLACLDALGASYGPVPLQISELATAADTSAVIAAVETFWGTKENFHE